MPPCSRLLSRPPCDVESLDLIGETLGYGLAVGAAWVAFLALLLGDVVLPLRTLTSAELETRFQRGSVALDRRHMSAAIYRR